MLGIQRRYREVTMRNFLVGLGLGIGVGFVVAPARGEETRRRLFTSVRDLLPGTDNRSNGYGQGVNGTARGKRVAGKHEAEAPVGNEVVSDLHRERNGGWFRRVGQLSRAELLEVRGIGPVLADRILKHRPYDSVEDLRTRAQLPASVFESLRRELAGDGE